MPPLRDHAGDRDVPPDARIRHPLRRRIPQAPEPLAHGRTPEGRIGRGTHSAHPKRRRLMQWILDRFFGAKLEASTATYLNGLASERTRATRDGARHLVKSLASGSASKLLMGHTEADEAVRMPLDEFMHSHALVSGASGSGKTTWVLGGQETLLKGPTGFGIIDPKQDLVDGCLCARCARRFARWCPRWHSASKTSFSGVRRQAG